MNFYDFSANTIDGKAIDFSVYTGKVILVVNTASRCGFTPQYQGLELLHQQYSPQGLVILGFPCNQFGKQESGTNDEIAQFCTLNYGVSFQMMAKVDVNGINEHPLYHYLKKSVGRTLLHRIKWNFTKFLINKEGIPVKRYSPFTSPQKMAPDLEGLLNV